MSQQVVTELVIDSAGASAGGAQFESAMSSAEAAAQKTVGSLADLKGGIGDTVAGFAGLSAMVGGGFVATLYAALDKIVSVNKGLADLQTMARQVGLSLADFQGVQFGGEIKGLNVDQINAGLAKSASLLNDAQRNENSLSKEFDANGLSIKNANGQLISQNQLLGIAADLVKRAQSPGDALAIAQMLGFTKEWIPLLEQGAGAMGNLTAEARAAGAVISDDTIARASEFDAAWRKSSVEFSSYMKAALLELLPFFDDLIERSSKWLKSINKADVEKFANDQLRGLADPIGLQDDIALKITIPPAVLDKWEQLKVKVDDAYKSLTTMADDSKISGLFDKWKSMVPEAVHALVTGPAKNLVNVESVDPASVPGYAASKINEPSYPSADAMDASFKKFWKDADAAQDAAQDANDKLGDSFSKVAARAKDANDTFDRAVISSKRHTDQLYADADAVGLGAGALAKYRTEAQLTSAAEAAGVPMTDALKAKISDLGDDAADAANDLEKLKVASNIDFASKTAFLSPQDVQIAQQLRGLYGNDVPAAMASTEAAAMRVNNAIKDGKDVVLDFSKSLAQGLLQGKSFTDALTGAVSQLASKMGDKALTDLFSGNFVQGGIEGIIAIGASMFAGDQKQKKDLADAQAAWAKMSDQVMAFNAAAKGFDLGPLTQQLQSLYATEQSLEAAALKAHDQSAADQIGANFSASIYRTFIEFRDGAADLSPVAKAIKDINDEAVGLRQTIDSFGQYNVDIEGAAKARIQAIIAQYTDQLNQSLAERLNTANGKGYLNDAAALLKQRQDDLDTAAALGNDPALLTSIQATFSAAAQKIIEDAGLVGDGFNDFIKLFPQFAGVVTQSATALQAANDKFAALTKTINDYLDSLQLGSNSILSPQDQLGAAQSQFNAQLALAQQGNADALGSITKYAGTLLDQAKSFFASSAGYGDVYSQVTAALKSLTTGDAASAVNAPGFVDGGLIGNGIHNVDSVVARLAGGGAVALAGGEHVTRATSVTAKTYPVLDFINRNGAVPGNDNGPQLQALGQQLVRAMAGISLGEINAMREDNAQLRVLVTRLIKAVEDGKAKTIRPAARGATG